MGRGVEGVEDVGEEEGGLLELAGVFSYRGEVWGVLDCCRVEREGREGVRVEMYRTVREEEDGDGFVFFG